MFERCLHVRESVAQIYNDQNGVQIDFLHEAGVGDRANFFQRVPALRPPAGLSDVEPRMDAVPAVGQHTEAVLRELGYADADVARMRAAGAI